jgi:inosine triphosphate pyrophosphatase
MVKNIVFVSENTNKYVEMKRYIEKKFTQEQITFIMHKPASEIYEIQSMDTKKIVSHKLKDANNEFLINGKYNYLDGEYWIMVDDTSLYIETLGGFPGPFIKYFVESMSIENISKMVFDSDAKSVVSLGICKFCNYGDIEPFIFDGVIDGVIVNPRGENGFGFDSIFRPFGYNLTNAEMNSEQKDLYNPRVNALCKLLEFIKKEN